jgi:acetyl-CoA acyltransferase
MAAQWQITREEMDAFALRSHQRAAAAARGGRFDSEIVGIATKDSMGNDVIISADETIRPTTTAGGLAELTPAFLDSASGQRFPQISWSVTAGNSSSLADGAAAMLIASRECADRLGITPMAGFAGFAVTASNPILMLDAPIPATAKVLQRAGLAIEDIEHFEINEAFASVPLAWQREFRVDEERLNPLGGAIALGHPLGASGVRLMTTMVHGMRASGARLGLQAMCEGSGMANATLLSREGLN